MASKKTEATEISLGFGLIGIENPNNITDGQIAQYFNHTLSYEKYEEFLNSYNGNYRDVCKDMITVGLRIRGKHSFIATCSSIKWVGPQNLMIATSLSKDLQMGPVAISAKATSDVVSNNSPYNLLIACPSGSATLTRSENWFLHVAKEEFQDYYSIFRKHCFPEQAENSDDFFKNTSQRERKALVRRINSVSNANKEKIVQKYLDMCHKVAEMSALIFNENYHKSINSKRSQFVKSEIVKSFFRLDSSEYILAGVDKREKIGLKFPDINTWRNKYALINIVATPNLRAGQAIVNFDLTIRGKVGGEQYVFPYHVQIRWSHGKLCGNPEGKLYKNFAWRDLPFVEDLLL